MKQREIYYIVYGRCTKKIFGTFKWFGKDIGKMLDNDKRLKYVNVTNSFTKPILDEINLVNNTDYK